MKRTLDLLLSRKTNRAGEKYPDNEALFAGLANEEPEAIRQISAKVSAVIFKIGKGNRLTDDDIEELICDSITICLQKIRNGKYVFQGYDPGTYIVEIAKNRALNFRRTAVRHQTNDLENLLELPEAADDYCSRQATETIEKLLTQLDPNCQNLIRLKYLEECRDKDAIDQNRTQYATIDSLKNQRARCMKKLVELGAALFAKHRF